MKKIIKKSVIVLFFIMLVSTTLIPMVNARVSSKYIFGSTMDKIIEEKNNEIATVYAEHYDSYTKKIVKEPIMELNKQDAEIIKQQLINASKSNLSNQDKIKEQMRILHEWKILPENLTYEDFEIVLDRIINIQNKQTLPINIQNKQALLFINPSFIMTGPGITSTLTIGGDIFPLELLIGKLAAYFFNINILNQTIDELLGGTNIDGGVASGPVYVGFGPSISFIINAGPSTQGFFKMLISPFIEMKVLFAGVHFTARIFENSTAITLFDLHINVALMGILVYLQTST
jgi:hypothetical protein